MAVITGFSAARMLAIEQASIVGGIIDTYGRLILSRKDGTTLDAGRVVDVGTDAPTPSTIVARDSTGRTAFADPLATDDADTKGARDAAITNETTARTNADAAEVTARINADAAEVTARNTAIASAGVSLPTINTVVRRDAAGRTQMASPVVGGDVANKTYVDASKLPLAQDSLTTASPASAFPWGVSTLLVNPFGSNPVNDYGSLTTIRSYVATETGGTYQYFTAYQSPYPGLWFRQWFYLTSTWAAWQQVDTVSARNTAIAVVATTGYRIVQTLYYTSGATFTKAPYPWLRAMRVKVQAGGGGGGGSTATGAEPNCSFGQGGAGGGYAEAFITNIAALAASVAVIVGAGGGGVAYNNTGGTGGSSSFGALVAATGGAGGQAKTGDIYGAYVPTAAGGGGTAGDIGLTGSSGGSGQTAGAGLSSSGCGGSSHMGGGGISRAWGGSPYAANGAGGGNYGGGAGGALSNSSSGAATGGNGGPGIVIVELYA